MKYIHELNKWPNFHWDSEKLTTQVAEIRHQQGYLLGRMSTLGFQICEEANLEMLTTNVVKSSEIEGEHLDSDLVRSSVARQLGLKKQGLSTRIDRHIDGVVKMMLDATQDHQTALSKERLFAWHSELFPTGSSGLHQITVGRWRTAAAGKMQVVSGPIGKEQVHFEAPEAERVDIEMDRFITWFNQITFIDPLIKAGIAHFWFVTIHPFEDGNGRIARALADLCLAKSDNTTQRFYSMSTQIEKERKKYYDILELCQKGSLDLTTWLGWFLNCLDRALKNSEQVLRDVLHKAQIWNMLTKHPLNERQKKVLTKLLNDFQGNLTSSKYAKLAKCSQDTALRDIQKLLEFSVLKQNEHSGRSTSYTLI